MTLRQLARRATRALRRHGVAGTVRLGARQVVWEIRSRRMADQDSQALRLRRRLERQFDREHGVDTAGHIVPAALASGGDNHRHANPYGATLPDMFGRMIASLPIQFHEYTLIDYGSGKGKAMLLASEFPFRRIIGVEFCAELHEVAQRNIQRYRSLSQRCHDLRSVCIDAAAFEPPDEPLVCYLYNPFSAEVMAKVLDNLRQSLDRRPREVLIAYHNPVSAWLMDGAGFLSHVGSGEAYRIYRSRCGNGV